MKPNSQHNSEAMQKKKLIPSILAVLTAVICIFALITSSSFGSFISEGNLKGVAVAGTYYFSSNVLRRITSESIASEIFYNSLYVNDTAEQSVDVRNYDAQGIPNTFTVTYDITFRLSHADSTREYKVGESDLITTEGITFRNQKLEANKKSSNAYLIKVMPKAGETPDAENIADVIITASPTGPEYMKSNLLGITLTFKQTQQAFSVSGRFVDFSNETVTDLSQLAGFIYEIIPAGYTVNPKITIEFRSDMLELNAFSQYFTSGEDDYFSWTNTVSDATTDESGNITEQWTTITISAKEGGNFDDEISLSFYRTEAFVANSTEAVEGFVILSSSSGGGGQ